MEKGIIKYGVDTSWGPCFNFFEKIIKRAYKKITIHPIKVFEQDIYTFFRYDLYFKK